MEVGAASSSYSQRTATYKEIIAYVFEKYGVKVHSMQIVDVKQQCGLEIRRRNGDASKYQRPCPPEKAECIKEALRHFGFWDPSGDTGRV